MAGGAGLAAGLSAIVLAALQPAICSTILMDLIGDGRWALLYFTLTVLLLVLAAPLADFGFQANRLITNREWQVRYMQYCVRCRLFILAWLILQLFAAQGLPGALPAVLLGVLALFGNGKLLELGNEGFREFGG